MVIRRREATQMVKEQPETEELRAAKIVSAEVGCSYKRNIRGKGKK